MTATSPRVVAFGDLLLRLNPPGYERLVQASVFEARYTGAEANVAAVLSSLGVTASVVSKVPDDEIGQACINYLRRFGIDTRHVARGGPRLGLFYLEAGAAQRPSKIIYDRIGSSFAQLSGRDFDWDRILTGAAWFHFSGTAPALGEGVVLALEEGLIRAKSLGLTVSCDLNYRARLWSPDEAGAVLSRLMEYVDVLIGNEEDAVTVFGLDAAGIDVKQGRLELETYRNVAAQLVQRFALKHVATTLRRSLSASINHWSGMAYDGESHYVSRTYEISPVVDRVGGGDAFSGGLIFGFLHEWPIQKTIEFATAASCLKHSIVGDFGLVSRDEIELLVAGDSSGRIMR